VLVIDTEPSVIVPLESVMLLPTVKLPNAFKLPPMNASFTTPNPPTVTREPVVVEVDCVLFVVLTIPFVKIAWEQYIPPFGMTNAQ
jgi:hypothetical protein